MPNADQGSGYFREVIVLNPQVDLPFTGLESYESIMLSSEMTAQITKIIDENLCGHRDKDSQFAEFRHACQRYSRQYLGLKADTGNQFAIVQFLDFSKRQKAEDLFSDYGKRLVFGFGDFYEKNLFTYFVDIQNRSITVY